MTSNSRNSQSEDDIDCDDGEDKVSMYKQVAERTPNFKSQTNRNRTFFLRFKYPIFIASFVALSALISGLLFWRCGKERALFAPISMPISLMYEGFRVSLFVAVCLFMHLCVYILFKLGTFLFMGKLRDSFAKSVSREFKLQLVVRLELQLCNLVSSILAMAASEFMFRIPTPATIAPDPSKQPQKIELGLSLFLDLYKYWSEFWGVYSQYPTFVKAAVHAIAVFFVLMTIEMVLMSIVSSRFHQVHFYGKIEKNDLAINLFENLKRQMRRSKKIKISLSSATITVQNNLAHLSAESPAGSPRNAAIPTQDSDKMLQSEIDREMGIAGVIFDFLQSLTTNEFLRVDDFGGFLSAQDAHTFFALVSADDNDTLTRTEFVGSIGRIYQAKQNIISSLSNHTIILDELDIIFKMIFVLLWILMTSQVLFLVVAAFAIIFSFLYESTLKALIKSIVFVIVTHPYDIGDSVSTVLAFYLLYLTSVKCFFGSCRLSFKAANTASKKSTC